MSQPITTPKIPLVRKPEQVSQATPAPLLRIKIGDVYKISHPNSGNKCSLGSTGRKKETRFKEEKDKYGRWKINPDADVHHIYLYDLYDEFDRNECTIESLEEVFVDNQQDYDNRKDILFTREKYWKSITPGDVSKNAPIRTTDEKRAYKAKLERDRYDRKHEEILAERAKVKKCECGYPATKGNMSRHETTDLHARRMAIIASGKVPEEIFTCPCGTHGNKKSISGSKHRSSNAHQTYLKSSEKEEEKIDN
jgi:hypothetical protein